MMAAIGNLWQYLIGAGVVLVLFVNQGESRRMHCNATQVPCKNNTKCVSKTAVCDGVDDCPEGSDEINCSQSVIQPTPPRSSDSSKSHHDYIPEWLRKYGYSPYTPSCEDLWTTNYCTDRSSTQCCQSYGYLGMAGSSCCASTQTPYTTCRDSYGLPHLCTRSWSTHCCSGSCCRSSRHTSTTGGFGSSTSAVSCSYLLEDIVYTTETCSWYNFVSPSCCDAYGAGGFGAQTCCEASSSSSTDSTTSDDPWYNDDTGSDSSTGGSGVVIEGVGGSVGLMVVLAIICVVIRVARVGARCHNLSSTGERRTGRGRRILVIRTQNNPVSAENPGYVAPQSASTAVARPPAYGDVVGPSAEGADAAPPSYEQTVDTAKLVDARA
ncbi:uncharacterized protein LOC135501052 [Lineus longissimus]|uniref:uncharacterized protein LOC135501052 n=1 Tax=Lineus longissimus TaxID=88925 RepID=UPI002B4EB48D